MIGISNTVRSYTSNRVSRALVEFPGAGIGLTMSILIGSLALGDAVEFELAKLAILLGSFISAVFGVLLLRTAARETTSDA